MYFYTLYATSLVGVMFIVMLALEPIPSPPIYRYTFVVYLMEYVI